MIYKYYVACYLDEIGGVCVYRPQCPSFRSPVAPKELYICEVEKETLELCVYPAPSAFTRAMSVKPLLHRIHQLNTFMHEVFEQDGFITSRYYK